jgi:hypothetical protein
MLNGVIGSFRAYESVDYLNKETLNSGQAHTFWCATRLKLKKGSAMDTNTLLIILVVIFLCGGFGFYGRGRWY